MINSPLKNDINYSVGMKPENIIRTVIRDNFYKIFSDVNIFIDRHGTTSSSDIKVLFNTMISLYPNAEYKFITRSEFVMYADNLLFFVESYLKRDSDDDYGDENANVEEYGRSAIFKNQFDVYGKKEDVSVAIAKISASIPGNITSTVSWAFKMNYGIDTSTVRLDPTIIYDECYPWFKDGVSSVIDSYLNSNSSIFLLYGPPGTGKTSFIRHFLTSRNLKGVLSYDEAILADELFFNRFITTARYDVMIIEDADTMLTSRDKDHNRIMNRFLNVSDGIIKFPSKKFIFTTNSVDLSNIDPALLRKGRCFAATEFRELTPTEAEKVATAANIQNRSWQSKSKWSLAEIFNDDVEEVEKPVIRKMGF